MKTDLKDWLKALFSQASSIAWISLSVVSTIATYFPTVPHRLRPFVFTLALVSFGWANFRVFQKKQTENRALRDVLELSKARTSELEIDPGQGSRYILSPIQNVPTVEFKGGYFEFYLMIDNKGSRNSTVTGYQIEIAELGRTFANLQPVENLDLVRGRHCMMGVWAAGLLSSTGIIVIPAESTTRRGTLLFCIPDITTNEFSAAHMKAEGPERKYGPLNCKLTLSDRTGTRATGEFLLTDA